MPDMFSVNSKVRHPKLGTGIVLAVLPGDAGVIVRFGNDIENCPVATLEGILDPFDELAQAKSASALKAVVHFQGLAIKSANDKWGVFNCSKIDLLPHQLWVCREARKRKPCRLMVADDVGLGKTIEAGITLSSYLADNPHCRVLVLTPAALKYQWHERLKDMFDIIIPVYESVNDTERTSFWKTSDQVIASYNTLSLDHKGRIQRLLDAEPWDLLVVDEAHHLNYDEHQGKTLGYELIENMLKKGRLRDMIFFTGTPHRGKDFGFLSLMHLLAPVFDPKIPQYEQLDSLREYMIRNNKYTITDLRGQRLFQPPEVSSRTYSYSAAETIFYERLTAFIQEGFLYADSQSLSVGRSVSLVLICMQKLASSSVAAIRGAISRRLGMQESNMAKAEQLQKTYEDYMANHSSENEDAMARIEAQIVETTNEIKLIENETPALKELLRLADNVERETKIDTILQDIREHFSENQILFFTEYKATQRLLLESLMREYGTDSVAFINGDSALANVVFPDGSVKNMQSDRYYAARKFNNAEVRFLIATEAAGEGIDLQDNCHVMFHVDLPWNPMRLHQRVGRLNRYGQKEKVIVHSFRNPDTVESRIWDKLNMKISKINEAFGAVMEEREDMFMLVLGMTPPGLFNNLFGAAPANVGKDSLNSWFDKATAKFGEKDVIETVKEIIGNISRFDYHETSKILPQVDLPDLKRFFQNILEHNNHKRLMGKDGVYRFNTPEKWLEDYKVEDSYDNFVFSRNAEKNQFIAGVGNAAFNQGLQQAIQLNVQTAVVPNLPYALVIYSAREQHTDGTGEKLLAYYGCGVDDNGEIKEILTDWQLLRVLNDIPFSALTSQVLITASKQALESIKAIEPTMQARVIELMSQEIYRPETPILTLEGILMPAR
jgi:ERCC4-related helicase